MSKQSTNSYKPNTGRAHRRGIAAGFAMRLRIPVSQANMLLMKPSGDAFYRMAQRHNAKARQKWLGRTKHMKAAERPLYVDPFPDDQAACVIMFGNAHEAFRV